jgi:hypothetical protein
VRARLIEAHRLYQAGAVIADLLLAETSVFSDV